MDGTAQNPINMKLLNDWQRDFPLVSRPFLVIAEKLGVSEADVITRLKRLAEKGAISRVGGVVRPNVLGASTLAATSVPALDVEKAAHIIGNETGVNHLYLRENKINLWFVATGPNRAHVSSTLQRIERQLARRVLDLTLERAYHIDLSFPLDRFGRKIHEAENAQEKSSAFELQEDDPKLVQALTRGLELKERPYQQIATDLDQPESDVLLRLRRLISANIVKRMGVIVRHRALGWRSNAMVVWNIDEAVTDRVGHTLAGLPGITLCYRRKRAQPDWPYNLYCMVHARARSEAFDVIAATEEISELKSCPREILFSTRCFKQTGALFVPAKEAAA